MALSKEALATILANRFDVDNEGFVVSSQELTRLTKRRFPNSKKTKKYLRKLKNIKEIKIIYWSAVCMVEELMTHYREH